MRLINNIPEPKKVLIVWQAPDRQGNNGTGNRFVVGEIIRSNERVILSYYDSDDTKAAVDQGFMGLTSYPFKVGKEYDANIESVLSKRLPPNSRLDYEDYLRSFRISLEAAKNASPIALLAYTRGKLSGDGFSFYPSFEDAIPPFSITFEIAGFRHNDGMKIDPTTSILGKSVNIVKEDENPYDSQAVAIMLDGIRLGSCPKGMRRSMRGLIDNYKINAHIERINGTSERPNILVFLELEN